MDSSLIAWLFGRRCIFSRNTSRQVDIRCSIKVQISAVWSPFYKLTRRTLGHCVRSTRELPAKPQVWAHFHGPVVERKLKEAVVGAMGVEFVDWSQSVPAGTNWHSHVTWRQECSDMFFGIFEVFVTREHCAILVTIVDTQQKQMSFDIEIHFIPCDFRWVDVFRRFVNSFMSRWLCGRRTICLYRSSTVHSFPLSFGLFNNTPLEWWPVCWCSRGSTTLNLSITLPKHLSGLVRYYGMRGRGDSFQSMKGVKGSVSISCHCTIMMY